MKNKNKLLQLLNEKKEKKLVAVISDFDGTITACDSLNLLMSLYGPPEWEGLENLYEEEKISGMKVLEKEIALLDIGLQDAVRIVREKIEIKAGFMQFKNACERLGVPLTIVSCNFRELILPVLEKYSLDLLHIRSNRLEEKNGRLYIIPGVPRHPDCGGCHQCKAMTVREFSRKGYFTIYIGDGLTDRCPSWEADIVFAQGKLKKSMEAKGMEYTTLDGFEKVQDFIESYVSGRISPESSYMRDGRENKPNPFEKLKVSTYLGDLKN